MPLGASNSLVISAACHVPVLEEKSTGEFQMPNPDSDTTTAEAQYAPVSTVEDNDNHTACNDEPQSQGQPGSETLEMQSLLALGGHVPSNNRRTESLDIDRYLLEVSQEPLRWGAVETSVPGDHHLSFGTRNHRVQKPVDGQWYQ